MIINC